MLFIPVSYSNMLIIRRISATATDVRTSAGELQKSPLAPRWRRFSHRWCRSSRRWRRFSRRWRRFSRRWCRSSRKWSRFHFRAETCATGATQKADSRCRFSPCFGTCTVYPRNLHRLSVNLHHLLLNLRRLPRDLHRLPRNL